MNAARDVNTGSPVEAPSETVAADAESLTLVMIVDLTPVTVHAFQCYEGIVLRLLPRHGGRLHMRLRSADQCFESHLITFARRAGYEAFIADPDRTAARALLPDTGIDQRVIIVDEVLAGMSSAVGPHRMGIAN